MTRVTGDLLDRMVQTIVDEVDPEQVLARALREGTVLYERR